MSVNLKEKKISQKILKNETNTPKSIFSQLKISIFDKYIFMSVFKAVFACIFLFMIVWIAPETLFNTIRQTMKGDISTIIAIKILIFKTPEILGRALPVGLLLGSLFTFDKLSKDSELTIFRAIGLNFSRIIISPIILSLFLTVLCFFVEGYFIPYSTSKLVEIKDNVRDGYFVHNIKDSNNDLKQVIIVSNFNTNNEINNVVVLDFYKNSSNNNELSNLSKITISDYAIDDGKKWTLYGVKQYDISYQGVYNEIETPKTYEIYNENNLATNVHNMMLYSIKKQKEISINELKNYLKLLKQENFNDEYNYYLNKLIQRYSHAFMCFLFTILGCLLGFSKVREQRLIGFTTAIGVIFAYFITLPFFDMLAEKSIVNPWITSTIQPFLVFVAILIIKKMKDL